MMCMTPNNAVVCMMKDAVCMMTAVCIIRAEVCMNTAVLIVITAASQAEVKQETRRDSSGEDTRYVAGRERRREMIEVQTGEGARQDM